MKTKMFITGILLLVIAIARAQTVVPAPVTTIPSVPLTVGVTTNDLNSALQKGLFEEEGNRDLDAAISAYQSLAAQFDKSRQVAATAIFRLGECYRKLGRTNEAVTQYDRVVREFSDQPMLVTLSRQNLAGLSQSPAVGDVPVPVGLGNASEETSRLAAQLKGIAQLKDDLDEQARAVLAFFPDETLKKMLLQLPKLKEQEAIVRENPTLQWGKLEEKLAEKIGYNPTANGGSFHTAYSPDGLELERHGTNLITDAHRELTKQLSWIKERVDFTVGIQKARLQVLQAVAAKTPVNESGTAEKSALPPDDEEKEIRRIQTMIQDSPDLINSADRGSSPLFQAASAGQFRVVTFLLDHGASVNLKSNGRAPLHGAAASGNKAMVELLLNRGADVNATDGTGGTALHIVTDNGFRSVAEALLAHHADMNARNSASNGEVTPLHRAASLGRIELLKLLIAGGSDVNIKSKNGSTPLSDAVGAGQLDSVRALLAAKADPDIADDKGITPLSEAAGRNVIEGVKILLDAKADPNSGNLDPPLFWAIKQGNTNMAELLLRAGADPNRLGRLDRQLSGYASGEISTEHSLIFACGKNQAAMVRLLLQFKADPNGKDGSGQPFIFHGLFNPDILKVMLDAGADPNAVEDNPNGIAFSGESPLMLAARKRFIPSPDGRSYSVSDTADLVAAKLLIDHGANVNASRPSDGMTVLHLAVQSGNRELIEALLANKADVNARNNAGETPLDLAKRNGTPGLAYGVSAGGPPLNYQWTSSQIPNAGSIPLIPNTVGSGSGSPSSSASTAELLRQHGALDDLPKLDRIEVRRAAGSYSEVIFFKETNNWNRFSLFEALATIYQMTANVGDRSPLSIPDRAKWSFPDLSQVKIRRASPDGKTWKEIVVDMEAISKTGDCGRDVPVEWGDVLEIPEKDHLVTDTPRQLPQPTRELLARCLKRTVTVRIGGESKAVELSPNLTGSGFPSQFSVRWALETSGLLRASSDTSRVKIIRPNSTTGKASEWVVDAGNPSNSFPAYGDPNAKLWLRDGDVIEVPEK